MLADDIARPLDAQDGVIAGVHEAPALVPHLHPTSGESRPVGRAVVDHLFPNGDTGRIPVVGITGSNGTTEVAHWVTEFLRLSGKFTGLACGDGMYLDRRKTESGDWKIVDVYLKGTVSELALRRSDFTATLDREGFPALLKSIDAKNADLAAGKAT